MERYLQAPWPNFQESEGIKVIWNSWNKISTAVSSCTESILLILSFICKDKVCVTFSNVRTFGVNMTSIAKEPKL